jgi:predicted nucleic acid-binding protein
VTVVVDASALAYAALARSSTARRFRQRLGRETCHAPHLIDAELGNLLRRRTNRDELAPATALRLLVAAPELIDHRHEMTRALALSAWELRENLTFYDGLYVALAAALDMPLLTADQPLTRSRVLPCRVELVEPL